MDWLTVAGFVIGIVILVYAYKSSAVAQHPSQRGLFIGTGLAALGIGSWMLVNQYVPSSYTEDLSLILFHILAILFYASMAGYYFVRKTAGPMLFEAQKPFSRKVSGLATAGLFVILIAFTIIRVEYSREKIAELFFYSSVVFYFGSPIFGKVEFREQGIIETYTLFRWNTISSYQWVGDEESNLIFSVVSGIRKSITIILTPEQKNPIDALLKQHVKSSVSS